MCWNPLSITNKNHNKQLPTKPRQMCLHVVNRYCTFVKNIVVLHYKSFKYLMWLKLLIRPTLQGLHKVTTPNCDPYISKCKWKVPRKCSIWVIIDTTPLGFNVFSIPTQHLANASITIDSTQNPSFGFSQNKYIWINQHHNCNPVFGRD